LVNQEKPAVEEVLALRQRVEQLEEELRVRDAFIVSAAHELRNPISPLSLHAQRMLNVARAARATPDDHVSAAWLTQQLETFSNRLVRFMSALNRILDVSKMRGGGIELAREPLDLLELTRDVIGGFERELAAARSPLTLIESGQVTGQWDRMRLEQIVSNLVSNAIRYGQSGPIEVSVRAEAEDVVLVVSDRGIGIRAEDQARIFERFERAETGNRAGFGVGLWIVRQLCLAMGGDVRVESRAGEGSSFTVTLPRGSERSGDDR
jgi:signal transduction histidine kinase